MTGVNETPRRSPKEKEPSWILRALRSVLLEKAEAGDNRRLPDRPIEPAGLDSRIRTDVPWFDPATQGAPEENWSTTSHTSLTLALELDGADPDTTEDYLTDHSSQIPQAQGVLVPVMLDLTDEPTVADSTAAHGSIWRVSGLWHIQRNYR